MNRILNIFSENQKYKILTIIRYQKIKRETHVGTKVHISISTLMSAKWTLVQVWVWILAFKGNERLKYCLYFHGISILESLYLNLEIKISEYNFHRKSHHISKISINNFIWIFRNIKDLI